MLLKDAVKIGLDKNWIGLGINLINAEYKCIIPEKQRLINVEGGIVDLYASASLALLFWLEKCEKINMNNKSVNQRKVLLGIFAHPDDMAIAKFAVQSACDEWTASNLNQYADTSNFTKITRIINGALTGLSGRLVYYNKAKDVFGI